VAARRKGPRRDWSSVLADLKVVWTDWQMGLAATFLLLYMIVHLPFIKSLVEHRFDLGWLDLNLLLPVVLLLILWQTVEISRRIDAVETGIRDVSGTIEAAVLARVETITKPKQQRLDVLGMNLRYGWHGPRRWVDDGLMDGWSIHLSAFLPVTPQPWTPKSWPAEADRNLREIRAYAKRKTVRDRGVTILAHSYVHTPAVHGYRLGNGDIFMAYVSWDPSKFKLSGVAPRYQFVPRGDKSPNAVAMRKFFVSWLNASQRLETVPSIDRTGTTQVPDGAVHANGDLG